MHRARLTRQAQNSHPSCRGRRPRRPVNSIKNAASGGIFTLSRGAERPNCDRPRSGHLSGRTRAPKASGRGGRGRNVRASGPAQAFFFGAPPRFFGQDQRNGVEQAAKGKDNRQQYGEFLQPNVRAGVEPRPYGRAARSRALTAAPGRCRGRGICSSLSPPGPAGRGRGAFASRCPAPRRSRTRSRP